MDNIQSNSQESILKEWISNSCSRDTAKLVIDKLDTTVKEYSLDYEKVARKIYEAISTKEIKNYFSYISAILGSIITTEIDDYRKDWKKPSFLALHLDMKARGFTGERWEKFLIDAVETHALNEFPIDIKDLIETNHAVIDYCKEKTYGEFLKLLLRSKLFKSVNVPLELLTKEAKEDAERWERNLAELERL